MFVPVGGPPNQDRTASTKIPIRDSWQRQVVRPTVDCNTAATNNREQTEILYAAATPKHASPLRTYPLSLPAPFPLSPCLVLGEGHVGGANQRGRHVRRGGLQLS